jgi:hypothetical protein
MRVTDTVRQLQQPPPDLSNARSPLQLSNGVCHNHQNVTVSVTFSSLDTAKVCAADVQHSRRFELGKATCSLGTQQSLTADSLGTWQVPHGTG